MSNNNRNYPNPNIDGYSLRPRPNGDPTLIGLWTSSREKDDVNYDFRCYMRSRFYIANVTLKQACLEGYHRLSTLQLGSV